MSNCGTHSGYCLGCRCDKCKRANTLYQRNYRKTVEVKRKAVLISKRRNRAAMLALRHLKQHDRVTYYKIMDEARAWFDQTTTN